MRPSALAVLVTRKSCAILAAKKMPDKQHAQSERRWQGCGYQTTVITVASITTEEDRGCDRRFLIEDQEKVPIDTMIMIATRAGIGIWLTQSPKTTQRISRVTPAKKQDNRPRPPDFTLIMLWPIIAQPAMPPMKPVAVLARPCPMHS
jgi:hypothetical protein